MQLLKTLQKRLRGTGESTPAITGHELRDQRQITRLLVQAYNNHVLFNAEIPDHQGRYSTALLGIYDEHGFIVLDELTPTQGHKAFLSKKEVILTGRLDGVELCFSSQLQDAREKNGVAYYKLDLPERLAYRQRRQDYRLPFRGKYIPFHGLRGKGIHQMLKGQVNDLSRKGVGIILEDDISLYQGEILPSCIIAVPDEGNITFSLEVRFIAHNAKTNLTRVGGRFIGIDADSLRKVRRCINRMERARARRTHIK